MAAQPSKSKRRPSARSAARGLGAKVFVPWSLYETVAEWNFYPIPSDPARILDIPRAQARFVDRAAIPSIVGSGVTVWGEELLTHVPLPPIRQNSLKPRKLVTPSDK